MRFVYQAAEEAATTNRRLAGLFFNPASGSTSKITFTPKASISVRMDLLEQGQDERPLIHSLDKIAVIIERYIAADLLAYANRALAELDEGAKVHLLAAKSQLVQELERINAIELEYAKDEVIGTDNAGSSPA